MKINYNHSKKFEDLKRGDVFAYNNYIWMAIQIMSTDDIDDGAINAVCLSDGESTYFNQDDIVFLLDAELIIK